MRTISAVDDLGPGFVVQDGLQAVRQRVVQRLRFAAGEWFLDAEAGIPFIDALPARPDGDVLTAQLIASEVFRIEDVTAVTVERADLDQATRRLHLEITVETVDGVVTIAEVV